MICMATEMAQQLKLNTAPLGERIMSERSLDEQIRNEHILGERVKG